jgi:hypothetical protein
MSNEQLSQLGSVYHGDRPMMSRARYRWFLSKGWLHEIGDRGDIRTVRLTTAAHRELGLTQTAEHQAEIELAYLDP